MDSAITAVEPDEQVMALACARTHSAEKGFAGTREDHWGAVLATSKRILFVTKGEREKEWLDIPLDSISEFQSERGLVRGGLEITTDSGSHEFREMTPKDSGSEIAGYLRAKLERRQRLDSAARHRAEAAEPAEQQAAAPAEPEQPKTPSEQLQELTRQREAGEISEHDFMVRKDELLTQL